MKRLRSLLPLIVLIALGVGLFFSGALDRFRPDNLAHEQAALQAQIAEHPLLAWLSYVGAVVLVLATGIPAGGAVAVGSRTGSKTAVAYGSPPSRTAASARVWIPCSSTRSWPQRRSRSAV